MKFLVGYDGSNVSKAALEQACRYAKIHNNDIVVVASVEGDIMTRDGDIQNAEEDLSNAEKFVNEAGVSVETKLLVRGFKAGEDIVKFANENDFEALFIGLKRRSKVEKMLFGSNTQYILLNVKCPVIAVK